MIIGFLMSLSFWAFVAMIYAATHQGGVTKIEVLFAIFSISGGLAWRVITCRLRSGSVQ